VSELPKEVRDYLADLADDRKREMVRLDAAIRQAVPQLPVKFWQQKLWGGTDQNIIGYGEMTSRRSSGNEVNWFIVGLALQKQYFSLYINAVENNMYLPEARKDDLGKVKVGKSSVSFKKLDDLNLEVALELVQRAANLAEQNV
jgi:hypothetical protein